MKIKVENPKLTLSSLVLVEKTGCVFTLELTTMKGEIKRVHGSLNRRTPNDRESLPQHPTLRNLVNLVIKRQHPVLQYVAERNGVRVVGYHEKRSFEEIMSCIEYGPDGVATRIVL